MQTKTICQSNLTAECWSIQIWGKEYCKKCEFKNTKNCGGKNIRKTGKNQKKLVVPIQ